MQKLQAKPIERKGYTMHRLYFLLVATLMFVYGVSFSNASDVLQFPRFRHVDRLAGAPQAKVPQHLVLLADEDFAPFSFRTAGGGQAGVSVQMALDACAELQLQCQVKLLPYMELRQALVAKQGDVIIGGPQLDPASAGDFSATRPYYFSFSQFVLRNGTSLPGVEPKALAGRRVGFVDGTGQAQFLKGQFDRSNLVPFSSEEAMFEALRTGGLDLAFADSLRAAFWLKGAASRNCCVPFGAGFIGRSSFTHGMVMLTRSADEALRDALDYALDRIQEKGLSSRAFATYLPSSPF